MEASKASLIRRWVMGAAARPLLRASMTWGQHESGQGGHQRGG